MAASSAGFRRVLFQIHLWVGLVLSIPLVILGLTGVALAWPEAVNRLTNPPPVVASGAAAALPASAYFDAARAAVPKARLQSLKLPATPGEAVAVAVSTGRPGPSGSRTVWLDPASARLIKVAPTSSFLFGLSHDLHGSFMTPGVGRTLVGWAGVAMLALSLSGLWLWWPRGGGLGRALRWRRTPDTLMNLHHQGGFWISLPLAVVSATGILICFPQVTSAVFGGPPPAPRPPAARPAPPKLAPDAVASIALAAHPQARLTGLTLPGAGERGRPPGAAKTWRVDLVEGDSPLTLRVNDADGEVAAAPADAGRKPAPTPMRTIRELHEGGYSLVWRWIVTLTGLLPLLLAVSGVYYWAKLELRKARSRKAA